MAQIGDLVSKAGIYTNPGVIVEKKEDGTVVVDTEPMEVNKYHRYTNTTGLNDRFHLIDHSTNPTTNNDPGQLLISSIQFRHICF